MTEVKTPGVGKASIGCTGTVRIVVTGKSDCTVCVYAHSGRLNPARPRQTTVLLPVIMRLRGLDTSHICRG